MLKKVKELIDHIKAKIGGTVSFPLQRWVMCFTPMIIKGYGCASLNSLGAMCAGSKDIDKHKYCDICRCLTHKNIFNT